MTTPPIHPTMYQDNTLSEPPARDATPEDTPRNTPAAPGTLTALFVAEESRLLHYAMTQTAGDFAAAQDLVQEAFLRLHRHGYDKVETPRAWLLTVIRHRAADRRKKRTEVRLAEGHDAPDAGAESAPAALERAESVAALRLLLADLPERDREIIRLKFHEDHDYATIAARTGLSVGNVGYRLHHLVKKLAAALAGNPA